MAPTCRGHRSVSASKSGRLLFAGYPGREADSQQCIAWDTVTGTVAATLAGHDNDVAAVAVAPDGMSVCTGSWDTLVRVRQSAWGPDRLGAPGVGRSRSWSGRNDVVAPVAGPQVWA